MPTFDKKYNKFNAKKLEEEIVSQMMDDDGVESYETWNPTRPVMLAFLKRDAELAGYNLEMVLRNSSQPLLLKEIKEQMLHSTDVIERTLSSKMASGRVKEDDSHYSLVKR